MINVLIAEDHTLVRHDTILLLKGLFPESRISQAINFQQLLQVLEQQVFELLILDLNIPGGDNLQMIDVIRLRQPGIKILIFSGYDEQLFAIRYLQAGANGYLMKNASEEMMREAIHTVLKNDIYISTDIKQQLLNNMAEKRPRMNNPLLLLSNRETEVMQQLVKGTSLSDIARNLGLQTSTVNTYKARIFEKMDVHNIIELVHKVQLYHDDHA